MKNKVEISEDSLLQCRVLKCRLNIGWKKIFKYLFLDRIVEPTLFPRLEILIRYKKNRKYF